MLARSMSNRYQLVSLSNERLLTGLSRLAHSERELVADLLAHLAELDERRFF